MVISSSRLPQRSKRLRSNSASVCSSLHFCSSCEGDHRERTSSDSHTKERATTVKVPPDTLLGDLASLVDSPRFSDVKLLVRDGKIIHAHKLLLQLRSRHFEIMFQSGMREASENVVHIENFQKTTMLKGSPRSFLLLLLLLLLLLAY